jgi:hypothetical protein
MYMILYNPFSHFLGKSENISDGIKYLATFSTISREQMFKKNILR